jgi:hypothetical protein
LRWCNAYTNGDGFADGDADTDSNANRDGFAYGDANTDAHADLYRRCDHPPRFNHLK